MSDKPSLKVSVRNLLSGSIVKSVPVCSKYAAKKTRKAFERSIDLSKQFVTVD